MQNEFNFLIAESKIKGGNGNPIYLSITRPNPNVRCDCTPFLISKKFDSQYGERILYFAYCPIHHINTWGYQTPEEALKGWNNKEVTNEKKMVREMW